MCDQLPEIWFLFRSLVAQPLHDLSENSQVLLNSVKEQLRILISNLVLKFGVTVERKNLKQINLRDSVVVVAVVKVESKLVQDYFFREKRFHLLLVLFKVNPISKFKNILPLFSNNNPVPGGNKLLKRASPQPTRLVVFEPFLIKHFLKMVPTDLVFYLRH